MKKNDSIVGIVAIICVFSIPVLGIMQPFLKELIPLIYIASGLGLFTLAARSLLKYNHELKIMEMKEQTKLKQIENEGFIQAERLIRMRTGKPLTNEEKKLFEDELLNIAKEKDSSPNSISQEKNKE